MILQAAGLALLAALSPTALLVGAVYLGSARARLVGLFYLAGAILMSLVMGLVVIVILRNAGLNLHRQHSARYGLRLGLGILMLAAGAVLAKRKPKMPDPEKAKQGFVSSLKERRRVKAVLRGSGGCGACVTGVSCFRDCCRVRGERPGGSRTGRSPAAVAAPEASLR